MTIGGVRICIEKIHRDTSSLWEMLIGTSVIMSDEIYELTILTHFGCCPLTIWVYAENNTE